MQVKILEVGVIQTEILTFFGVIHPIKTFILIIMYAILAFIGLNVPGSNLFLLFAFSTSVSKNEDILNFNTIAKQTILLQLMSSICRFKLSIEVFPYAFDSDQYHECLTLHWETNNQTFIYIQTCDEQ